MLTVLTLFSTVPYQRGTQRCRRPELPPSRRRTAAGDLPCTAVASALTAGGGAVLLSCLCTNYISIAAEARLLPTPRAVAAKQASRQPCALTLHSPNDLGPLVRRPQLSPSQGTLGAPCHHFSPRPRPRLPQHIWVLPPALNLRFSLHLHASRFHPCLPVQTSPTHPRTLLTSRMGVLPCPYPYPDSPTAQPQLGSNTEPPPITNLACP